MLLRAHRLARFYGPGLIFKDVSLDIQPGTITLLAGVNGAGKSTLLKILAGLLRPSAGEILLGKNEKGREASVGFLGHQTFIYPELTAVENLRFWASLYKTSLGDGAYADMLERVELAPFAEEKARVFSRGMAQRLNLARLFMLRSDILLLDEPGTGLDARSTAILHRELVQARQSGAGIVWITHSLAQDKEKADRIAVLDHKTLAFLGAVNDFSENSPPCRTLRPDPAEARQARGGELC